MLAWRSFRSGRYRAWAASSDPNLGWLGPGGIQQPDVLVLATGGPWRHRPAQTPAGRLWRALLKLNCRALSRLRPLRPSDAARSARGRLRLLGGTSLCASGWPVASSAGSRAQVPSSHRFSASEAPNGTNPCPFAASPKTALASAVRWRRRNTAAITRTSMRGCENNTELGPLTWLSRTLCARAPGRGLSLGCFASG